MADCSYSRCIQQRRYIRRELQRWTKNMVYIVGLERIAEELMGRRKWKLYQASISRNYLQPINNNVENIKEKYTTNNGSTGLKDQRDLSDDSGDHHHQHHQRNGAVVGVIGKQQQQQHHQQHQQPEDRLQQRDDPNGGIERREHQVQQQQQQQDRPLQIKQEEVEEDEGAEQRTKDWTPQSKCYFCVDGKLDSENSTSHGALSPQQTDSADSSDIQSDSETVPSVHTPPTGFNNSISGTNIINNNHHHHQQQQHQQHQNMTTIESVTSMAALASAVAALSGKSPCVAPPFYPQTLIPSNWYLANMTRSMQPAGEPFPSSGERTTPAPTPAAGEQPLDLSSKSTSSVCFGGVPVGGVPVEKLPQHARLTATSDTKQIFKAKPRMSAIAGKRTYTEDELQAALRDIQSGKLGTRRAAVIYGIPRSTLRNKVYKLAMERERELHLNSSSALKIEEEEVMDDDKELSGAEEEKEVEKALQGPLISVADILRVSNAESQEALKAAIMKNKDGPDWPSGLEQSALGSYLQSVLLAAANQKITSEKDLGALSLLPDFIKKVISEEQFAKEQQHLLQQQQQQHHHHLHQQQGAAPQSNGDGSDRSARLSPSSFAANKSRSELSDMETDESPTNVILKIPSFKPTSSKNGNSEQLYRSESVPIISPPITSDSGSPPILPGRGMTLKDVKDVIAKSISQKFQQPPEPMRMPSMMEIDFKRSGFTPPIGGGATVAAAMQQHMKTQPELTRSYSLPHTKPHLTPSQGTSTGGKGTRPKRGKYRNYDRDSLVEAVRAVQRGEMSVHRAGSYYGVPHSTLEYKVKERHLMRPRKRDPKPNPVDEKLASLKQNDLRAAAAAAVDKLKPGVPIKQQHPQAKFPPTSPNGLKLPGLFDPSSMTSMAYNHAPFPFWPQPPGYPPPHMCMEYGRSPSTSTSPFPPNPDQFFASQMMQKLQEESARHPSVQAAAAAAAVASTSSSSGAGGSTTPTLPKSARQIAESLLDGTGTNGSFLDGIIRSSLESGVPGGDEKARDDKNLSPENMSNKTLLDQLCRNSRLTPLSRSSLQQQHQQQQQQQQHATSESTNNSSGDEHNSCGGRKAGGSPLNFSKEDGCGDVSPPRNTMDSLDLQCSTIELSNDSNDSRDEDQRQQQHAPAMAPGRIYLKQELTNPDNLKPEMLVRFRDIIQQQQHEDIAVADRNGLGEPVTTGSASESDAAQD